MKYKSIIWGLVFVAIGVIFILRNLEILSFSWYDLWRLWPMVILLIGIAILPVKDGVKVVLSIVALAIGVIILIYAPSGRSGWFDRQDWFHRHQDNEKWEKSQPGQIISEPFDSTVTQVLLDFDAAAGNFDLNSTSQGLFEFIKDGNIGKYNYAIKDLGSKREVIFEMDQKNFHGSNLKNNVEIKLNPFPLWDLKIDVGAADIDMDLTPFRIGELDIDGGASSIYLKIGSLSEDVAVRISAGASSIKLEIPSEFACELNLDTVLSSKDIEGFNRVGDGTYVTPDFSSGDKNIVITIDAAVSELKINRY
jgi:hypothetical protein